jgi:hypothetical protein
MSRCVIAALEFLDKFGYHDRYLRNGILVPIEWGAALPEDLWNYVLTPASR